MLFYTLKNLQTQYNNGIHYIAALSDKFDFGFARNLLEFKRPAIDAFSHRGDVRMLVPMPTNVLFYDLEKPRAFGSLQQILRDTRTEFLNCLCPGKTGTNGIRTWNGDVLTLISPFGTEPSRHHTQSECPFRGGEELILDGYLQFRGR